MPALTCAALPTSTSPTTTPSTAPRTTTLSSTTATSTSIAATRPSRTTAGNISSRKSMQPSRPIVPGPICSWLSTMARCPSSPRLSLPRSRPMPNMRPRTCRASASTSSTTSHRSSMWSARDWVSSDRSTPVCSTSPSAGSSATSTSGLATTSRPRSTTTTSSLRPTVPTPTSPLAPSMWLSTAPTGTRSKSHQCLTTRATVTRVRS